MPHTVRRKARVQADNRLVIIIVNSIPPYCYELNNILALPNGFEYRFRYKKHWIPTIEDPMEISNKNGLIVLRHFDDASFCPIRRMYIKRVLRVGDIYYIGIQLQDLIEFDSESITRTEQLRQFGNLISSALAGYQNPPQGDLENLIFFGTDFAYNLRDEHFRGHPDDREYNRWGNVIDVLGTLPVFNDIDFYRVIDLRDQLDRDTPMKSSSEGSPRYVLRKGSSYTLQIVQRTYTGRQGNSAVISPRQLQLVTEPQTVQVLQGACPITGKYDIYPLLFRIAGAVPSKYSFLLIRVQREGGSSQVQTPDVQIPIEIRATQGQVARDRLLLLAFVVAAIALLFSSVISKTYSIGGITVGADVVQRVSVLVLVLLNTFAPGLLSRLEIALPTKSGG